MFCEYKPAHVVEIGSGFSSAALLDCAEYLSFNTKFAFVDPFPDRLNALLRPADKLNCEVHSCRVQDIDTKVFDSLGSNDLLFIDSSHVSKVGSDVNFLVHEILPSLQSGVLIHIHDIYWPFEYPEKWFKSGICWNEAYLVRAFLSNNSDFQIVCFSDYCYKLIGNKELERVSGNSDWGSSLWIRRV
jgi:hypothetical protein